MENKVKKQCLDVIVGKMTLVVSEPQRLRLSFVCEELQLTAVGMSADAVLVLLARELRHVVFIVEVHQVRKAVDACGIH